MGVLWFNAFIIIGLIIRRLKFPVKFSVIPLLLLLVLSVLRMLVAIDIPGSAVILSETIYPAIVRVIRYEIVSYHAFEFPISVASVFIFIWVVVAFFLIVKHISLLINRYSFIKLVERLPCDKQAEVMLAEMIRDDKQFRVFRMKSAAIPFATAFKPYIVLPEIDFSPDELRVILRHEWKHIQDKDYLRKLIIDLICFVYWWNPLVYVFRNTFSFAQELKCDQYAISNKKEDINNYLTGIIAILEHEEQKKNHFQNNFNSESLFAENDELTERLKILVLSSGSRSKRILTNACYSIVIFAVFIMSYMFVILPIFWGSNIHSTVDDFRQDYIEDGGIFRADENFLIDNEDGTFSLYINGQFVGIESEDNEYLRFLPVRIRKEE